MLLEGADTAVDGSAKERKMSARARGSEESLYSCIVDEINERSV